MVIKLHPKQLEMFPTDKPSAVVAKTDNMAEKKRLAQALLSRIEANLEIAENLLSRQNVRKK